MLCGTQNYRVNLRVEIRINTPGVTNKQANNQHEDLDIGLDEVVSVAEPAQSRHVLHAHNLVELDLLVDLH